MRINDAIQCLVGAQQDWKKLIVNPGWCRVGNDIAWTNYSRFERGDPRTAADLRRLVERGQYSFGFRDGSLSQLYYHFGDRSDRLVEARLAFYKRVKHAAAHATGEEPAAEIDVSELEILPPPEGEETVEWIRIDYDPRAARAIVHSDCHVHVGGLTGVRISLNGVPTPRQFVEFIVAAFYPEEYEKKRSRIRGGIRSCAVPAQVNRITFGIRPDMAQAIHLHVPTGP